MKKTVSVNIRGLNFIIEEDAYELLQDYLDRLNESLRNEKGNREIIEDVELRIAELCTFNLTNNKTVVELLDIQEIIAKLGDPSQYIESDEQETSEGREKESNETKDSGEKRLFRDADNAVIAGVCAGIASFFKIDVVIIRAIFVVLFLFGGFGFPLYIILWIIVPKTRSTIDRLRMKGRPINVDTVREEVEMAAANINKGSKRFAQQVSNDDHYSRSVRKGFRVLLTIFGSFLIFVGILMLIPFLIFLIGGFEFIPVQNESGFISFPEFGKLVLAHSSDYSLMATGALMLGFSVIIFLILWGSLLVFNIRNKWAKLTLLLLFLTGLSGGIMSAISGVRTGKDFMRGAEEAVHVASIETDELTLLPSPSGNNSLRSGLDLSLMEIGSEDIQLTGIHIKYLPSPDSLFHIHKQFSARGKSSEAARARALNISHDTEISGDTLHILSSYSFPKTDKLRDQEVELTIQIPKGGTVRLKDRIISLDGILPSEIEEKLEQEGYLRGNGKYRHD